MERKEKPRETGGVTTARRLGCHTRNTPVAATGLTTLLSRRVFSAVLPFYHKVPSPRWGCLCPGCSEQREDLHPSISAEGSGEPAPTNTTHRRILPKWKRGWGAGQPRGERAPSAGPD